MKIIGSLLFFNKEFMTTFTTTIGSTVYLPSKATVEKSPISYSMVLLHELVHIYDANKHKSFSLLYLFPQILALLSLPLLLISWKLALPMLLFLLPIPAYFRMHFEKRAYMISLYATNRYYNRLGIETQLQYRKDSILKNFTGSAYYFMWPFNIKEFDSCVIDILDGKRPYEDDLFNTLDKLIDQMSST